MIKKNASQKQNPQNKQKKIKKKQTDVQSYVDKILGGLDGGYAKDCLNHLADQYYIKDMVSDLAYDDNVSKKITEKSAYNALKNNKKFKDAIEKLVNKVAFELTSETIKVKNQIDDQNARNAKYEKEEALRQEKLKKKTEATRKKQLDNLNKSMFKRNILSEELSASQKKVIKDLYNIDIDKVNANFKKVLLRC
jgi:hypothetical protein